MAWPWNCSGDMYAGVPSTAPACVSSRLSASLEDSGRSRWAESMRPRGRAWSPDRGSPAGAARAADGTGDRVGARGRLLAVAIQRGARQAEVDDPHAPVADHHVVGLEVAVDRPLVRGRQPAPGLGEDFQHLRQARGCAWTQ